TPACSGIRARLVHFRAGMPTHRVLLAAPLVLLATLALAGLCSPAALAHSLLVEPRPISDNDDAKSGPCGCYFGAAPESNEDPSPQRCPVTFPTTELVA